jgi:hypothetical protein
MQMRKNGLRPWRHVVIKTEIPAGWRRFAYMCRFVVLACATLAVFAAEMPERTPMLLNPRHVLRLRGGSTIGAKDDEVICASHRSRPHHTRNRDLEEDAPKPRKLEDALQKLAEQGCEFEDEGGLGGLIALNEECAKWVESGIGVPAGFTEELLGCRFEPPPSIDSTEEDIVEGDKALEGQNGLGDKRGTEDEIVAAGGSLNAIGLAPNGSQKPEGNGEDGRVSEQCERGRPSRDRKNAAQRRKSETSAQYEAMTDEEKQVEARELLAEIEEDAAAMLQVGIKSDFALVRAAMRMIQPNATKAVRPIRSGDVVVDLGCGDGRVCIEATLAFNCSSCGVDIDIQAVRGDLDMQAPSPSLSFLVSLQPTTHTITHTLPHTLSHSITQSINPSPNHVLAD